jgi:SAM-dependent methyltransferase
LGTKAVREGHDWQQAGAAWGHAPADWACFYERYSLDVLLALFMRTGIGPGVDLLDVACGSGLLVNMAVGCGATVSGIDAAAPLIEIARDRTPAADLRLGSMFDLPWQDASFDVVMSMNGIWGDCEGALHEMRRVVRPGGTAAIAFWGRGTPLDMRPLYLAMLPYLPQHEVDGLRTNNNIAKDGVAEKMLEDAGFTVLDRGARVATVEWPDDDVAWRAMASSGPIVEALSHPDRDGLRRDLLAAIAPCRDRNGIYRFRNDHQFVIARAA